MITWLSVGALACGGFFGGADGSVYSATQEVVLRPGADGVEVEYLVSYGGDEASFGWVIPVPGAFRSLEEGDPLAFDQLREPTTPEVYPHAEEGGGCGAVAGKGSDNALSGGDSGYTIVGQGRVGVFEYTALAATDSAALLAWLDTHGWSVGPSGPSIDAYVAEGGWQFVAVSLVEEAASGGEGGRAAVRIAYEGSELAFPARMSRYSMSDEQSTTVWVVGDQAATLSGWDVVPLQGGEFVTEEFSLEEQIREAVAGGDPTYALTWAGELNGAFVTRFDTITASGAHTADPRFTLDGGDASHQPDFIVYESERARRQAEDCRGGPGAGRLAGLAALWLVSRRRRPAAGPR